MFTINATKRQESQKTADLRKSGKIPAVFYGSKTQSTGIVVDEVEFTKVQKQAGESTVITLTGDAGEHDVLIHDFQIDPVTGKPIHIDFYALEKGQKVRVNVPVEFEGVAPAVREKGGILVKVMHEIEIEAEAKNLPHSLIADIGSLVEIDSHITAQDIKLPNGVVLITKPEEVVALVSLPKEEKEETGPIDLSAIEVEKKGKEANPEEEASAKEE